MVNIRIQYFQVPREDLKAGNVGVSDLAWIFIAETTVNYFGLDQKSS